MKRLALVMLFGLVLPAAAQTPARSVQRELLKLEDDWSQASINRDASALQRFYADEYVFIDEDGVVTDRAKELKNLTTGDFRLDAFKFDDMKVRLYGNVAVVTGRNTIQGVWVGTNRDVSGPYRFTDIFVKRDGRWVCVSSQSSRVTFD